MKPGWLVLIPTCCTTTEACDRSLLMAALVGRTDARCSQTGPAYTGDCTS